MTPQQRHQNAVWLVAFYRTLNDRPASDEAALAEARKAAFEAVERITEADFMAWLKEQQHGK